MTGSLFSQETVTCGEGSTVHLGFTSLAAGNLGLHVGDDRPATVANRARLEDQLLGESPVGFTYLEQVHGTAVFDADSWAAPRHRQGVTAEAACDLWKQAPVADAVSTSTSRPLAIMVADCIPLVFVGEHRVTRAPIVGLAHAGRRGLLDGVIQAEVADLVARGAVNIRAWIGPSICGRCYEVPHQMQAESAEMLSQVAATTSWGTPGLDLPAGARAVLSSLDEVVEVSERLAACTLETPELFSHRGVAQGQPAGRIAGLVWVENS